MSGGNGLPKIPRYLVQPPESEEVGGKRKESNFGTEGIFRVEGMEPGPGKHQKFMLEKHEHAERKKKAMERQAANQKYIDSLQKRAAGVADEKEKRAQQEQTAQQTQPVKINLLGGKFNRYTIGLPMGKAVDIVLEPEQVHRTYTDVPGTLRTTLRMVKVKWQFKCTGGLEVLYKAGKGPQDNTTVTVKMTAKTFQVLQLFFKKEDEQQERPDITIHFPQVDQDQYPPSVTGHVYPPSVTGHEYQFSEHAPRPWPEKEKEGSKRKSKDEDEEEDEDIPLKKARQP